MPCVSFTESVYSVERWEISFPPESVRRVKNADTWALFVLFTPPILHFILKMKLIGLFESVKVCTTHFY